MHVNTYSMCLKPKYTILIYRILRSLAHNSEFNPFKAYSTDHEHSWTHSVKIICLHVDSVPGHRWMKSWTVCDLEQNMQGKCTFGGMHSLLKFDSRHSTRALEGFVLVQFFLQSNE